ncbi:MAG: flagellar basal body rod protein FlgC [Rhodospirillales bacterium]|nr:flagellar basal body rod protein FlgC [Alphaproteobacteria bacterium]MCB9987156.1 flagellar basal body rod protein FlgC [Rhodospirillales bacterium]USO08087.1 MAG: flagellar basal body rod protein FlgC [Rhodospirillales bacterium]
MEIMNAIGIAASGMRAQGDRLRVISENIANADTTATVPGGDPYRRKSISFKNVMDKSMGVNVVQDAGITQDMKTPFRSKFMPESPVADSNGYIKLPNINPLTEIMDMREAQRSYEANLGMIDIARGMMGRTLDLLHG